MSSKTKSKVSVNEVISPPVQPPAVVKEKYLECPFCGNIEHKHNGLDLTSSWCSQCGKCFQAIWKEP